MEKIPENHIEVTYKDEEDEEVTEVMSMKEYNERILVRALRGSVKIISFRFGDRDPICVSRA